MAIPSRNILTKSFHLWVLTRVSPSYACMPATCKSIPAACCRLAPPCKPLQLRGRVMPQAPNQNKTVKHSFHHSLPVVIIELPKWSQKMSCTSMIRSVSLLKERTQWKDETEAEIFANVEKIIDIHLRREHEAYRKLNMTCFDKLLQRVCPNGNHFHLRIYAIMKAPLP